MYDLALQLLPLLEERPSEVERLWRLDVINSVGEPVSGSTYFNRRFGRKMGDDRLSAQRAFPSEKMKLVYVSEPALLAAVRAVFRRRDPVRTEGTHVPVIEEKITAAPGAGERTQRLRMVHVCPFLRSGKV